MSQQIQAIYENGLLRPLAPLDLSENCVVKIEIIRILNNTEEYLMTIKKDLAIIQNRENGFLEKDVKS